MNMHARLSAFEAAQKFVEERFPDCGAALLAGSVTREKQLRHLTWIS
ncbi:hypothetical protein [Mesobacillus jeotgali]|nr:hypothetical protein [Mesobacillus jeotgali]